MPITCDFFFPLSVCMRTHIRARSLLSSDVLTALTAIPANGQIQEITPRCHHKANRKAPILPPDAGPKQGKQPQARLHNALSSFCPTNTWMGIQLILFHPGPFSQPAWHRGRILCSSALPCVLHIRVRRIEREGKKGGIFIRKRINAQSALFGRYIRPIH